MTAAAGSTWLGTGSGGTNQNFIGFEVLKRTGGSGNDTITVTGAVVATLNGGAATTRCAAAA